MRTLFITEDLDRPTVALLIGLRAAGVDVRVVCSERVPGRAALAAASVPFVNLKFPRHIDRGAAAALRAELLAGGYGILHVGGNRALQNSLAAIRGLDVKLVVYRGMVGNVSFFSPISWLRLLNPRIDRIVCVCDAVRDFFLGMRPAFLRMPADRPVTIYKGHSLDWYRAQPVNLTALGVPAEAFTIGCAANYRPRKGIEYLVRALALLPPRCNAHLVLIGDMRSQSLQRAIAASGAGDRIHLLGFRDDAPAVAAACQLFVLPSVKREGLARALIEAMAYGVAPIVTNCGGSPELVVDGDSGLVVPVRDARALAAAILKLHDEPGLRLAMGKAARARIAAHFRIESTIAQTLALYRALVAAVPGEAPCR